MARLVRGLSTEHSIRLTTTASFGSRARPKGWRWTWRLTLGAILRSYALSSRPSGHAGRHRGEGPTGADDGMSLTLTLGATT